MEITENPIKSVDNGARNNGKIIGANGKEIPQKDKWWKWVCLILFTYISIIGANAICELEERKAIFQVLTLELDGLNEQIKSLSKGSSKNNFQVDVILSERRDAYKTALVKLRHLSIAGALDYSMTLTAIRKKVFGLPLDGRSYIKDQFGFLGGVLVPSMIDVSSDGRIYTFLVLFACVLGCFIQHFRGGYQSPIQTILVGVGAGIVCYLAIAAGKVGKVFHEETVNVPYGVLLGFLAGVFSGHVYEIVESFMHRFKDRA